MPEYISHPQCKTVVTNIFSENEVLPASRLPIATLSDGGGISFQNLKIESVQYCRICFGQCSTVVCVTYNCIAIRIIFNLVKHGFQLYFCYFIF